MITILSNTKVMVTGISGFIGSHLARRLVREEAEVAGLVRKSSNLWRIEDFKNQIRLYYADITDFDSVKKAAQDIKPQMVFHLAAYGTRQSDSALNETIQTNIIGTVNVLQAVQGINPVCIVNFGSCFEYGNVDGAISEDSPLDPNNFYAASKVASWLLCNVFHKLEGMPIVTLRLFTPYGPFEAADRLIPNTIIKALQRKELLLTEGEQKRDYIFMDDIIEACIRTATTTGALGQTINLGTGKEHSVKEVVITCLNLMGNPIEPKFGALPYRADEIFNLRADTKKAKDILGWEPKTSLADGLKMTVDWFQQHYLKRK